jgi:hypothetical protein
MKMENKSIDFDRTPLFDNIGEDLFTYLIALTVIGGFFITFI